MSTDRYASPNAYHKSIMRDFLQALGLIPVGITTEDIMTLNKALTAGSGTPNKIFMSPQQMSDILNQLNK